MSALARFWWAVPIAGLLAAWLWTEHRLADTRLTLANERRAWTEALRDADVARATAEQRNAMQLAQAATSYADRIAARAPVIVRSTNTVREYASTDAGRVRCLDPERLRAIDALDADLADTPAAAERRAGAVPADQGAAPERR